mmetsp:Transcript_35944/g.46565  ORF Transcript_35944/g.46565 Transcript_35944/m.46565 type:complete len:215 (+) Transcript_35944:635-1279(+)
MAKVGATHMARARRFAKRQYLDEGFFSIGFCQRSMDHLCVTLHIHGRKYAPIGRDQMRSELYLHLAACDLGELLIELPQMPVRTADCISMITFAQLRVQQVLFQGPPCAGYCTFQVENDLIKINHFRFNQRTQRKLSRRCITAGPGHNPRGFDLFPVKLGQAIHRLFLNLERIMLPAIPFGVFFRVSQTEICTQIDYFDFGRQLLDYLLRSRMR